MNPRRTGVRKLDESLFDQFAGEAAVDAAVDGFYPRALAGPRIREYFEGVDMER